MSDTRNYYVICDDNCRFPSMTSEQILAAIAEATGSTPTHVDDAFITKIREMNGNANLKFWVGTTAEFNALATKAADTLYILSDDDTEESLETAISSLSSSVTSLGTTVTSLETTVSGHTTSISTLQTTVSGHTTSIGTLETNVSTLQTTVSSLQSTVAAQGSQILSLTSSVGTLETTVSGHRTSISTLTQSVVSLNSNVSTLQTKMNAIYDDALTLTITTQSTNDFTVVTENSTQSTIAGGVYAVNVTYNSRTYGLVFSFGGEEVTYYSPVFNEGATLYYLRAVPVRAVSSIAAWQYRIDILNSSGTQITTGKVSMRKIGHTHYNIS